jgi:hypothetical protein
MRASDRPSWRAFTLIALLLATAANDARADAGTTTDATQAESAAADDVVQVSRERREAGEALTPEFVGLESEWLRHKALCDFAATDRRQHLEAARKYVERVSELRRVVRVVWDGFGHEPFAQTHLLDYFFHEAELWLAKVSAGQAVADPDDVPVQQNDAPREPREAERRAAAALLDAAREVWRSLKQRADAGEAPAPEFVELQFQSSRRLCEAERQVDPSKPVTLKALRAHLDRVTSLHTLLDQRFKAGIDVSRVQVSQAAYYVEEAKLWLVRAEAR